MLRFAGGLALLALVAGCGCDCAGRPAIPPGLRDATTQDAALPDATPDECVRDADCEAPADECVDDRTLRRYRARCDDGACVVTSSDEVCQYECCEAVCLEPCGDVLCNEPPICFAGPGDCVADRCVYPPDDGAPCDDGDPCTPGDACAGGACVAGPPVDCSAPPGATCADETTVRTYTGPGWCDAGACAFPFTDRACVPLTVCDAAACVTCPGLYLDDLLLEEIEDGSTVTASSIAVATDGVVRTVYDIEPSSVRYAYRTDAWTVSGSSYSGGWPSIALAPDGAWQFSYYAGASGGLRYGGSFGTSTVDSDGNVGEYSSIAVASDGTVHIAYYDATDDDLKHAELAAGVWSIQTVDTIGNVGRYASLAIAPDGTLHIAYRSASAGVRHAEGDTGSWTTESVDSGDVTWTSMGVAPDGTLHIAWYEGGDLEHAERAPASGWATDTISTSGDIGAYTDLAVDEWGAAHVSTNRDLDDLVYAVRPAGATWAVLTVDSGNVGTETSIAVAGGAVHINYCELGTFVRYARFTPACP